MKGRELMLGFSASMGEGAVALLSRGEVLEARSVGPKETISARMVPLVREMLEGRSLAVRSLSAVGADVGPGSFTGMRIALSAARALAWAAGLPAVKVLSQDVLARSAPGRHGRFVLCMDARRGKVYAALYERDASGGPVRLAGPALVDADRLEDFAPRAAVLGEHPAASGPLPPYEPRAFAELLRLAWNEGPPLSWKDLLPLYLRKTEAEEKWEAGNRGG